MEEQKAEQTSLRNEATSPLNEIFDEKDKVEPGSTANSILGKFFKR